MTRIVWALPLSFALLAAPLAAEAQSMATKTPRIGARFMASLAHPGGNVTGVTAINPELSGKRLDLLKQAVPRLSGVAILWNPDEPNAAPFLRVTQAAGRRLG